MSFGKRIRDAREDKELTQLQLARKLNVTRVTIVSWEKGDSEPRLSNLKSLAIVLDKPVTYFLAVPNDFLAGSTKPVNGN